MANPEDAVVLVVEDNPDNLYIAMDLLLEEVGVAACEGFSSGKACLAYLHTQPPPRVDLILLDIQIPHEDGYEVLKKIRDVPDLASTTVVALTANVMPQDVDRARAAGFDGFIGKPIDSDRFPVQIERVLAGESVWEPR